jgi:hypothetical protein
VTGIAVALRASGWDTEQCGDPEHTTPPGPNGQWVPAPADHDQPATATDATGIALRYVAP